jgi:methyl-accepting chemotaxis protein
MVSMFLLMTINSIISVVLVYENVSSSSTKIAQKNLDMLNTAISQSLRNAMNTGSSDIIHKAENDARNIKGVVDLKVAQSKHLIELFSTNKSFTNDKLVLESMLNKKEQFIESDNNGKHTMRILKPMVATSECIFCHTNQIVGDVIGVVDLTFSMEESDEDLYGILKNNIIIATLLAWFTITIIFFLIRYISKPIESLKESIDDLSTTSNIDKSLEIKSNDEIGEVAISFNNYLEYMRKIINEDKIVVKEANEVIQMAKTGFFTYKIQSSSSNEITNELKNTINNMIDELNSKLQIINNALSEFGMGNFKHSLKSNNSSGVIGSMIKATDALGNNSSELLSIIFIAGEELNKTIDVLSSASSSLSKNTQEQANSLELTAQAIDDISRNINLSVNNVNTMSNLADDVNESANIGKKLANKTALSMDEINTKVQSINEAITVIDQIAFQTNILSLNAAVEAATAGEAGKGFAVVAQEVRNLATRSAQAANEIKILVEDASIKTNEGKIISDEMITGYEELTSKINQTKDMIEEVSNASISQSKSISLINDSINTIDKSIHESAIEAKNIDDLSCKVSTLSKDLLSVSDHVTYREETKNQVCDINRTYLLNKLQLGHIKFKDSNFEKLDGKTKFTVTDHNSCALGKWIAQSENNDESYTKTQNWSLMKEHHYKVHNGVQEYINLDSNSEHPDILIPQALTVVAYINHVFESLNTVKIESCNIENR